MKIFFFISFLFLLNSCTNNKTVYWCGDHACINKKEKEAYFKKTMIVEKKIINNKVKNEQENNLIQKVKKDEKKRIKNEKDLLKKSKLERKRKIKEQKRLAKQLKLDEKKRIKEEKKLTKQLKSDEKKRIEQKKLAKKTKLREKNDDLINNEANTSYGLFTEIKEMIIKRNQKRTYPSINDIDD